MKKIIVTLLILLAILLFSNYNFFKSYSYNYVGGIYYYFGNYKSSLNYFSKSNQINKNRYNFHNIGNSYLKLFLETDDKNIDYVYKSIDNYLSSLKIEHDIPTYKNYLIAKAILENNQNGGSSGGNNGENNSSSNNRDESFKLYYGEEIGVITEQELLNAEGYYDTIKDRINRNLDRFYDPERIKNDLKNEYSDDSFFDFIFK